MAFKDRLKEARLSKGFTQEQIAEKIGVAKSTFTGYEKGNSEPSMYTISKIMNALKVDANFLWQDEMDALGGNPAQLKYNELKHMELYRALDDTGRTHVDTVLQWETDRMKQIASSNAPAARVINYYYRLASAGTGQIVFDMPPTRSIEIPDIPEYKKADYAIGVNGSSMEPTYHDGDVLLVEMTDHVDIGEIGIFMVDGQSYVKQLGCGELISLNTDYNNIPLTSGSRCMGRVIAKLESNI